MADLTESLEMMKDVAKIRIEMLKSGVTFHEPAKKALYLQAYEEKLRELEKVIRKLNIRLVPPSKGIH